MNLSVRCLFIAASAAALTLTVGFFFQQPWATGFWPWPTSRLSNVFIASILAASAMPVLWIGLSGELAAVTGGAINLCITYLGIAAFSCHVYFQDSSRQTILWFAIACTCLALLCMGLASWARRIPFRDTHPLPGSVRISFAGFLILLVLTGGALVLNAANVFPWPLKPEQAVLYGWIFLGAACYFLYALIRPEWGNAQGQLLGFLAYDLVLIVPFLEHFATVQPRLRINLAVYTAVLVYSGLLSVYYLFLNKETRFPMTAWRRARNLTGADA